MTGPGGAVRASSADPSPTGAGDPCATAAFRAAVLARFAPTAVVPARSSRPDDPPGGWRPAWDYLRPDSSDLGGLLARERRVRDAPTDGIAGSLVVLEYARLVSWPVLSAAVREGRWLDPAADNVRVHLVGPPPGRVGFVRPPTRCPVGVRTVIGALLDDHLAHLVEAVHLSTRVGRRVLWGNVAAAVGGAFLALSWLMPERDHFLDHAARYLNADPRLHGLVDLAGAAHGGQTWMTIGRRACCLAFRCGPGPVTGPGGPQAGSRRHYCGTCPVLTEADRAHRFRIAANRYAELDPAPPIRRSARGTGERI